MPDRSERAGADLRPTMVVQMTTAELSAIVEVAVTRALSAMQQPDRLLSLRQAQAQYDVSPSTLRGAIRRGLVQATRGPRQRLLVADSELRRWLTACPARGQQIDTQDEWSARALESLQ